MTGAFAFGAGCFAPRFGSTFVGFAAGAAFFFAAGGAAFAFAAGFLTGAFAFGAGFAGGCFAPRLGSAFFTIVFFATPLGAATCAADRVRVSAGDLRASFAGADAGGAAAAFLPLRAGGGAKAGAAAAGRPRGGGSERVLFASCAGFCGAAAAFFCCFAGAFAGGGGAAAAGFGGWSRAYSPAISRIGSRGPGLYRSIANATTQPSRRFIAATAVLTVHDASGSRGLRPATSAAACTNERHRAAGVVPSLPSCRRKLVAITWLSSLTSTRLTGR